MPLCSEFLSDVCEGVLQLELQSASGLRVADVSDLQI
jgi:hypothetical protein